MIEAGLGTAGIRFGTDGSPVAAALLAESGARLYGADAPEPALVAVLTNDRASVEIVLGAILAGATLVSLPLPARGADLHDYAGLVRSALIACGAATVVARDDLAEGLRDLGLPVRDHRMLGPRPLAHTRGPGFELVQFSSGSTRNPRPIAVDDRALGINVSAILATLGPRPGDVVASWLPLSHDMGLIGMLLATLAASDPRRAGDTGLVLLDPADFLRRPDVWIAALSEHRAAFTAAPDSGYRLALRRRAPEQTDLTSLRCTIVGGEIVRPATLELLTESLGPRGLSRGALCPAYGLAEVGLCATMTPPGAGWRERHLATAALGDQRFTAPSPGEPSTAIVASGCPLPGYEIRCEPAHGDADQAGPGGGAIAVRGESTGVDGFTRRSYAGADGWMTTGDIGFVDDGWLYVVGRTDDYIVVRGRNVYAPSVEAEVGAVPDVRSGRVTALGLPSGEWIVVAEATSSARADGRARLVEEIRRAARRAAEASPDDIVVLAPGTLPMTSSGKLQRHEVQARWLRHELAGDR
jgi:acyl-CoA synthetase (AMP-forming)/AMP-acid ligase II